MPDMSSAMRAASKAYCPTRSTTAAVAESLLIRLIDANEAPSGRPNMARKIAMPAAWNNAMKLALRKITDIVSGCTLIASTLHWLDFEMQLARDDVIIVRTGYAPGQCVVAGGKPWDLDADLLAGGRG